MKPINQNMYSGKRSFLFEYITLGVAIVSALVALVTALIVHY